MTLQVSTKYKELILGPTSFAQIFDQGYIALFTGIQPPSADHPITGTYLGDITTSGMPWVAGSSAGGLHFEQSGPWISKRSSDAWRLTVFNAGTAGWFRLFARGADDGSLSYNAPRIDGSVGLSSTNLVLSSTVLAVGPSHYIQQWLYTIPPVV